MHNALFMVSLYKNHYSHTTMLKVFLAPFPKTIIQKVIINKKKNLNDP